MPEDPSAAVVELEGLSKTYRDFWGRRSHPALRDVSLTVSRGESHALLGPNGSGKTTTLRLLLGLVRPTGGSVRLFGASPSRADVRARVGFLPEQSTLHGFLRCDEALSLFGRLRGMDKAKARLRGGELLEAVQLADASRKRVRELSHGMRRRLALAVAMVGEPELLVLDEPTQGMDPLVRGHVLELVAGHVKRGGALLVTSHLLGDIRGIATDATLLRAGEVCRQGRLDNLLRREGMRTYQVRGDDSVDTALREAVANAGGEVVRGGPARATIEELFVETYRQDVGSADTEDGDGADAGGR